MATAVPEPPLIRCGECGFPVPEAMERLGELESRLDDALEAIDGLERDLRGKRSQIRRLEGEAADRLERNKHFNDAVDVLHYWKQMLAPKAREVVSEARLKPTIARLSSGHTVEGLRGCIEGYAKFPYVVKARRSPMGLPSQKYVDVGLIFRDAAHVEEGLRLRKRDDTGTAASGVSPPTPPYSDWRQVRRENHRTILQALTDEYGPPMRTLDGHAHESDCPRCKRQLLIFSPSEHPESLLRCYGCGLDEAMFFRALKDTKKVPAPDDKVMQALDVLEEMRERLDRLEVSG